MAAPQSRNHHTFILGMLGFLMASHMTFLGFGAKTCTDLIKTQPTEGYTECRKAGDIFQRAAETYVAILLALLTPLAPK